MSPWLVATVVALLLISPSASAQTVPALAAGVPPQVAPHPINVPAPPDPVTMQKLGLLRERIVQRDQIQREIDQLIVETRTPQEMVVHLELLEVNRTMAEKLGISSKQRDPAVSTLEFGPWTAAELEQLRAKGAVQTLAAPKLEVVSGQQATSQIGVAHANSDDNGVDSPFTDIRVRADSLGNNRVRVEFNVDHATPAEEGKSQRDPLHRMQHSSANSRIESAFGESQMLGGLISRRTRTRRGALGRVTETIHVEMVLLIRTEAVMPTTAGVVPATAISPG
jgi:hypothetical protein